MLALLAATGFLSGAFLIQLLIVLIVVCVAYWLIVTFLPEPLRKIGIAVIVVLVAIYIIKLLGS